MVLGTAVMGGHVDLGGASIRCGTVVNPDRAHEISSACGPARARQLRAALMAGAVLVVVAIVPAVVQRRRPVTGRKFVLAWAVGFVIVTVVALVWLGTVTYTPDTIFFDL
ncbi:MAG: hypothetical protein QOG43_1788 [Actinomycetota bacterium]|nr:hypothetical protein [Actinomycetota bacterium]